MAQLEQSMMRQKNNRRTSRLFIFFIAIVLTGETRASTPEYKIEIINHLFQPATITIPADVKVKLLIHNRDATPEEFESYELNREKVIMGNSQARIFVGPLAPGRYPFFGEFNPKTAQGVLIVE